MVNYKTEYFRDKCRRERKRRVDKGLCVSCYNPRIEGLTYCIKCRERHKNYHAKVSKDTKEIILNRYGTSCACCGETIHKFLTLDHVHGGGKKHRELTRNGGHNFYRMLIRDGLPDGYQILCWNCNSGRHLNNGVCPHKDQGS